jgi:hypothetical protein
MRSHSFRKSGDPQYQSIGISPVAIVTLCIQTKEPVVKAFNTVFATDFITPVIAGKPTLLSLAMTPRQLKLFPNSLKMRGFIQFPPAIWRSAEHWKI